MKRSQKEKDFYRTCTTVF